MNESGNEEWADKKVEEVEEYIKRIRNFKKK